MLSAEAGMAGKPGGLLWIGYWDLGGYHNPF